MHAVLRLLPGLADGRGAGPQKTLDWLKDYAQKDGRPLIFYGRTVNHEGHYTGLKRFGFGAQAFRDKVAKLRESSKETAVPMRSA